MDPGLVVIHEHPEWQKPLFQALERRGAAYAPFDLKQAAVSKATLLHIDVTGDTATAASRWAFVTAARGPGIQVAGRYEDTLVREDGGWKFKTRQAFNDLPAQPVAAPAK